MARKTRRTRHRQVKAADPLVIVPRRMKRGEKQMLADLIKAAPMTTDLAKAKKFAGRNGAHKFLARHRGMLKKFRWAKASSIAA